MSIYEQISISKLLRTTKVEDFIKWNKKKQNHVITCREQPVAVLMSYDYYMELQETLLNLNKEIRKPANPEWQKP